MSLLKQLAKECFHAGRPLEELVTELVESEYNQTISKSKGAIRAGVPFQDVVNSLVHSDGLPLKTATSLVFEAQDQVAKEVANENLLRKATESAIALLKNGVRSADRVNNLLSQGCPRDLAERIVKDNQHLYR